MALYAWPVNVRELRRLVEGFQGNVKEVVAFLGKDRKQIYRWLRPERIDPDAYRPDARRGE
jgi:DNA-binding NtrC family response regulator